MNGSRFCHQPNHAAEAPRSFRDQPGEERWGDARYLAAWLWTRHDKLKVWQPDDSQTRLLQKLVRHRRAVIAERTALLSGECAPLWRMQRRSTILLVEDNPDDVLFFERALGEGRQDYDLHIARSGEEAIDYLQRACRGGEVPGYPVPKFIIMDNHMPCIAGSDFLLWMSEHSIYSVVPTVILSGSDQPSEVKLAFELGVHGYFVKPMGKTEFTQLLKMIFHYWAESCVPPVKEYRVTAPGEQPVLKTDRG